LKDETLDHDPRRVTDLDASIGTRLRMARLAAGFSQTVVADHLGVSFQQVQKYERGSNRISAATLYNAASLFGVSILFFFEDAEDPVAMPPITVVTATSELVASKRGQALLRNFAASSPRVQSATIDLLRSLRRSGEDDLPEE